MSAKLGRSIIDRLGLSAPIIQAPMAGTATPALAAAVCNAGALGSIALGSCANAGDAARQVNALRALTSRPFNVNVFTHCDPPHTPRPASASKSTEDGINTTTTSTTDAAWLAALTPAFAEFKAAPPRTLRRIYESFNGTSAEAEAIRQVVIEARPAVVSFHFGLPRPDVVAALKCETPSSLLLCTVTNMVEAEAAFQAGMDAVVAQGWEAGGHRGLFDRAPVLPCPSEGKADPTSVSPALSAFSKKRQAKHDDGDVYGVSDPQLGTFALVRQLTSGWGKLPVIAAGGIMDGAGIRAALELGAIAAQLGTAFIACPESNADAAYRKLLVSARWPPESDGVVCNSTSGPITTVMTRAISGRPARCLSNRFTALGDAFAASGVVPPAYPCAYDAGKALHAAAAACGDYGFGAYWAGQGAPLARALPAADLVALLRAELGTQQ